MGKRKQIRPRPAIAKCYIDECFGGDYKVTELCRYVGITRQAYYNILSGVSLPRVDMALKICEFFNEVITPDEEYKWTVDDFWKLIEVPEENAVSNPDQIPLDL